MSATDTALEAGAAMPSPPPQNDLFRAAVLEAPKLKDETSDTPVMFGHFALFEQWAEVDSLYEGHFFERILPGAFAKTMAENRKNMRVLFHHGIGGIGFQVLGTIEELTEDMSGAYYEVAMFDSVPPLIMEGLRAGQYGSSYKFDLIKYDFQPRPKRTDRNPEGIPELSVIEAKVKEFGPTPIPVQKETSAGMRSLTDDVFMERLTRDPERFGKLLQRSSASITGTRAFTPEPTPKVNVTVDRIPERRSRHEYKRSVDLIGETVWLIHPSALATIVAIIGERASGYRPTDEEIKQRIGTRAAVSVPEDSTVAVLPLHGPIVPRADVLSETSGLTSVEAFQADFRAALADPNVSSILIDIDSPGGDARMIPELASEIMAARGQKPIVAQANSMAGSGAYWLACAADEIVVTPSGDVGSIGAYTAHTDLTAAQEKAGIKTTLVSAGEYKVERNPFQPLSEAAQAEMQSRIDSIYEMFVAAVADGRGVDTQTVLDKFGQGRMVQAPQAVKAGMADRVGTYDETLARLQAGVPDKTRSEPEPPAASTPPTTPDTEPEPSEATTHTQERGLFWFASETKNRKV
jgi:capsid assembly protease